MTNTRRNLLRQAQNLIVVYDGAYSWVGLRDEVYECLREHGYVGSRDPATLPDPSVRLSAYEYETLCNETTCITATHGSAGDYPGDPAELISALEDRGTQRLCIDVGGP